MAPPQTPDRQLRVEALPGLYAGLVNALRDRGLNAAELHEVFAKHVAAECVQCGIRITGEEMGRMHLETAAAETSDPKQARLAQGYCARRDCNSYYYRPAFAAHPKFEWAEVLAALDRPAPAPAPEPAPRSAEAPKPARFDFAAYWAKPVVRVAAGLVLILALLLCRHLLSGGSLPLVHRDPGYKADPTSLER